MGIATTPKPKNLTDQLIYDVVVIGGGIVGCAMARRFTLEGADVCLVEKASDILDGASKANSAILHTGFDAPSGSLELDCIRSGYQEYKKIHKDLNLPIEQAGAHVVAWNEEQKASLEGMIKKAHKNGVGDVEPISAAKLARREPNLSNKASAAIWVPGEALIDPWSAPYSYLKQSLLNGGEVIVSCEVIAGEFDGTNWALETGQGVLRAKHVINCSGLYGDLLDEKLTGSSQFKITPRKGQFVVFDKTAYDLVSSIILPVPDERTKGVVICRTVFGNLLVGPTAQDQQSRKDAATDKAAINDLIKAGTERLPALKNNEVTAVYAGLRPACEHKDYQIELKADQNWISVGAIRSTGLSAALGIAQYVYQLYQGAGQPHKKVKNPRVPTSPVLAQRGQRDWRCGKPAEIVCHCELVTKSEIDNALEGPLAAKSLAGLKRQTRVTMGRCQGFYCTARLAELTTNKFETPLSREGDDD